MAKAYSFDEPTVRKIAAAVRRILGTPRMGQGSQPTSFFGQDRLFCTGKVYGGPLPAGTPTAAGSGEFILDQIELAGKTYVRADATDPQPILNTSDHEFAEGDRVNAWLDTAALHTSAEDSAHTARWVTGDLSGDEATERCLYLCGSQTLTVENNDTNQQLLLVNYQNMDPTTFQVNVADWTITLLRAGKYEVRHDFTLIATTAGGDLHATESATAYFRNGTTLGTSVIGCSGVLLTATSYASDHHGFENAGRTWYATSAGGMTPSKIDWVVKRNTFTNGMAVNLTSARIRFLGDLTVTSGSFDAPP